MSFKDYFNKAKEVQSITNKSAAQIADEVESVGYHTQDIIKEERFIPQVDYRFPENFAKYGSAEEYYDQALKRIYEDYPYDGSLKEKLEWENDATYLDLHLFENAYPRTNGYVIFSANGGAVSAISADGYGTPTTNEYIYFKGGPHPNPGGMTPIASQFTGSNYYESALNRENNLKFDLKNKGVSVEFWLKKPNFITGSTQKEVIFDLWNGLAYTHQSHGRLRLELTGSPDGTSPFRLTAMSGTAGIFTQNISSTAITTASVADNKWHHYALTLASSSTGIDSSFYVDGTLNNKVLLGSSGLNEVTGALRAHIGALIASPSASSAPAGAGKLSGSLDEFRYWKTERTGKDIGRYWFTQVGGGTNTDPTPFVQTPQKVNTQLGVYYKFNEGITGNSAIDSVVLDYSGRITNGAWTGYSSASRNTGSAIVISNAAIREFKDPIIHSFHPKVRALAARLKLSGSNYDVNNNASIYNSIPAWIMEEDIEGQKQLKYLTQILASYFDTLQLQIGSLSKLQTVTYPSSSHKPLPFAEHLLQSAGFVAPELFIDADVLEKLADRSEDRLYEKSLQDIKNTIYHNIYNNLVYIYKSKGTEKSFRNLMRCFGIDDELVKLNVYAGGVEYEVRNNRRNVSVAEKFVDFNTADNKNASVFQFQDPLDTTNTTGIVLGSNHLTGGYAHTLEADILFPKKPDQSATFYFDTNVISASLFGVHQPVSSETNTTWHSLDDTNFQVYAVRDEITSPNVRFVLTGTVGGHVPKLTSPLYQDTYNNSNWNLAVRIKPENYPLAGLAAQAQTGLKYTVELHGVQVEAGVLRNEFTVSETITPPVGFITGSRRTYIGAHRTNFTGSVLQSADVKVNACRYWMDYLNDRALRGHAFDTRNYGSFKPHSYAYPFQASGSYGGEILQADTLAFNWEFSQVTGSNTSGQFTVSDEFSGSAVTAATRFDWLGNILGKQHPALGTGFPASSIKVTDKDFVVASKLQLPENIQSSDAVTVLNLMEQKVFTRESRPIELFYAFEKSMAQALSVEMINYFATLKDIHNIIGEPVNRYRPEYKGLKVLRQRFFSRVSNNEIDFEKFYEFYKWFDSSLTMMLQQLVPASADFAENVRTVIESHMLERSKYQHKFQNVKQQLSAIEGTAVGSEESAEMSASPEDDPQGTGFYSANAYTKRVLGTSQPINFKRWALDHAPPPAAPGGVQPQNQKSIWWQTRAERNNLAIRAAAAKVNKNKQTILTSIKTANKRAQQAPYRFGGSGNYTLGGVGFNQNKRVNFVYRATEPFGPTNNNAAVNVVVGYGSGVEQLRNTTDVYHPAYKQRLGFEMDPDANRSPANTRKADGNLILPFSLYSSSVTDGANAAVVNNYATGTMITNLHHDLVYNSDIPMQSPFTEKFVGGRQYRHTEINAGSDDHLDRAEGWKIEFSGVDSATGADFDTPMLGVVPPNYEGGATNDTRASIPTAQRLRNVGTKRPVNIQNIKMVTSSLGTRLSGVLAQGSIGNYQKNYQVVQSNAREKNDPFFNDQSFDFALNPETLATRGRPPLTPLTRKSLYFDGSNQAVYWGAVSVSEWEPYIGGSGNDALPVSFSFWMKADTGGDAWPQLIRFGSNQQRNIQIYDSDGSFTTFRLEWRINADTTIGIVRSTTGGMTAGTWYHVVATFAGGNTGAQNLYINGTLDNAYVTPVEDPMDLTSGNPFIGGSNALNSYKGYLCDAAVWNRELTAAEAKSLYGAGSRVNPAMTVPDQLLSWLPLGSGPGDNISDDILPDQAYNVKKWNGDPANSPTIVDDSPPFGGYGSYTQNPGGDLDYNLPQRTGANSNQSIIVNRFAGCGYEVMSRGYMDPAHEELSVYNALPYRNLAVINYGLSGSASVDPIAAQTITVVDQIGKNRGLDQRSSLHCGPFGSDAAYGSVPALTYVTTPSYHKTNRNATNVSPKFIPVPTVGFSPGSHDGRAIELGTVTRWNELIGAGKDFSISFWLYLEDYDDFGTMVFTLGNYSHLSLWKTTASANWKIELWAGSMSPPGSAVKLGQWQHWTIVYDDDHPSIECKCYVDGVYVVGSNNNNTGYSSYPLNLGKYHSATSYNLIGNLANFAVWTRPLSALDVEQLYADGPGSDKQRAWLTDGPTRFNNTSVEWPPGISRNLVAWYRFSKRYGDTQSRIINQRPDRELDSKAVGPYSLAPASGSFYHWDFLPTYDNHYVQHAIPRSTQQYSWVTSSLANGRTIGSLYAPSAISASVIPGILSGSQINKAVTFNGMSLVTIDPVNANLGTLGFTLGTGSFDNSPTSSYLNPLNPYGIDSRRYPAALNFLNTVRNGPYGYPTWKQIRTGEGAVARRMRQENLIGALVPPPTVAGANGFIEGLKSNQAINYKEGPVDYGRSRPMIVAFEDNTTDPDEANNVVLKVPFQGKLEYFDNEGLNSRLGLQNRYVLTSENAVDTIRDYGLSSSLSAMYRYGQKAYPAITNAGTAEVRTRQNYSILDVWNDVRNLRSLPAGAYALDGATRAISSSVWPLDANLSVNFTGTVPGPAGWAVSFSRDNFASDILPRSVLDTPFRRYGAGILQNPYCRWGVSGSNTTGTPWPSASAGGFSISASVSYVMPIYGGGREYAPDGKHPGEGVILAEDGPYNILGNQAWTAATQTGIKPYKPYSVYSDNLQKLGKGMSIVPEFRISEHLEQYEELGYDYLNKLNNLFTLTGSTYPDSSYGEFYKTYTNADFLKFFKIVDDKLQGKANQDGKPLVRYSLDLKCDALLQFLPYKGFYPAERSVELGRLFKKSMADYDLSQYTEMAITGQPTLNPGGPRLTDAFSRILMEPLMAPGILFNSIKSGIGVGNFVVVNRAVDPGPTGISGPSADLEEYTPRIAGAPIMLPMLAGTLNTTPGKAGGPWLQVYGNTMNISTNYLNLANGSSSVDHFSGGGLNPAYTGGYYMHKIPFDAIRDPERYLNKQSVPNACIFDTGMGSASFMHATQNQMLAARRSYVRYSSNAASQLYKFAIDNFLCETYNFFQSQPKTFLSEEEDNFLSVKKDHYYGMKVVLKQPSWKYAGPNAGYPVHANNNLCPLQFGMYNNPMSFGPPLATYLSQSTSWGAGYTSLLAPTWEHVLPPHFYGQCEANIIFKAPYSGKASLDDIQAYSVIEYDKDVQLNRIHRRWRDLYNTSKENHGGNAIPMSRLTIFNQITSSVNIVEKLLVVPDGTTEQKARWMIQPKWETPVMNFYDVSSSATPGARGFYAASVSDQFPPSLGTTNPWGGTDPPKQFTRAIPVRGMWHQYGSIPTGSSGIFLSVEEIGGAAGRSSYNSTNYGEIEINSLPKIVGFDTIEKRIGTLQEGKLIEEAIVCVPFITTAGDRRFFDIDTDTQEFETQSSLLNKYIFPPTFDFLINETVNPIAFYAFEFSATLDQEDLQRIWQNLPPKLAESSKFQKQTSRIKIRGLVDRLLESDRDLQWMVFKVKRKAEKDYNIFKRKSLTEGTPIVQSSLDTPYTYNWPYDYFSLVELVSIDQEAVYTTEDLTEGLE